MLIPFWYQGWKRVLLCGIGTTELNGDCLHLDALRLDVERCDRCRDHHCYVLNDGEWHFWWRLSPLEVWE